VVCPPGSYAQKAVVPANKIVQAPSGIAMETAAALMMQGATASLYVTRPMTKDYIPTRERLTAVINAVFEMYKSETLEVLIGPSYALEDAAEAHRNLESRNSTGKLVLSAGNWGGDKERQSGHSQ